MLTSIEAVSKQIHRKKYPASQQVDSTRKTMSGSSRRDHICMTTGRNQVAES